MQPTMRSASVCSRGPSRAFLSARTVARSACGLLKSKPGSRTARLIVLAEDNGAGKSEKTIEKQEKIVQDLKKGGMDAETANRILKVWEETGAKSPDQLRKLLVGKSLQSAGLVGIQTLLDAGASWGGFTSAASLAAGQPFFGKVVIEYFCYFLGLYFGTSVFFDLFTLGAIAYSTSQYSTNSEAFLGAVRQLAGPKQSGINVIQKAQQAVNTAKVVNALNKISGILRERGGESVSNDSLGNLSVFLLLQKAEESGFRAADYNLSGDQAATIAAVFSKYDLNDDMVLSVPEVTRLFQGEGYDLNEAEVKQAIKLLDKNNDNLIQFSEFVDWWQNEVSEEAKQKLEKAEAAKAEAAKSK